MTDTRPPQTVRSLTDLVEVVPTFFGFHPTDSLVLLAVDAGSVALGARVDLDATGGHATAEAASAVWRRVPGATYLAIAFCADPDRAWWALDDVDAALPAGCARTLVHADDDRWYAHPDDVGTPYDRLSSVHLARAAYEGRPVRCSREELARLVEPTRTPAEVTASLERVADREDTLGDLVAEALALVEGHDAVPGDLDLDEATILCLASHDPGFLEAALLSTTRVNAAARAGLWAQVVQASVPNCAGGALVALGLAGWVDGNGALGSVCLEALEGRPGPVAWVGMLDAINRDAVHPDAWAGIRAGLLADRAAAASGKA